MLAEVCLIARVLGDVDALQLENHRTRAIVAAGDHHVIVVRPLFQPPSESVSSGMTDTQIQLN